MPNLFTLKILYVIILFEKRFILRKVIGMNQILVTKNDKSKKVKEKKELEEKRRKEEKENQEKIKRERIVELSKKGVGYITEEEARLIGKEKEWNDLIDSIIDNFPYCYIPAKDDYEFQKNPITPFALFNFMKKFNGRKK